MGGEYYINRHVSLGGEIGLRFIDMESNEGLYYSGELYMPSDFDEGDIIETVAAIFLRYYF